MDLGVAQLAAETLRLSQTGAFVGSVHYAAPEQFAAADGVDHRADLYALWLENLPIETDLEEWEGVLQQVCRLTVDGRLNAHLGAVERVLQQTIDKQLTTESVTEDALTGLVAQIRQQQTR